MKKKLMASILCLSLLLIMLLGSTLAWFTDDVGTTNTMVVGNVKIEQHEKYRETDANGEFVKNGEEYTYEEWDDTYTPQLFPAVIKDVNLPKDTDGLWVDTALNNEIDKIVTVENTGESAAYVRTVFAFEMMAIKDNNGNITGWENPLDPADTKVHLNVNGNLTFPDVEFEMNGVKYVVGVYTYTAALAPKATSDPSLLQVYLDKSVGNEFYDAVGEDGYQILVLSQAVQTQGFDGAEQALTEAFGEFNATNAVAWFAEIQTP